MRRAYSRLETVEEKRNTRKAVLFGFLSIVILVLLAFYGIPLTSKLIGIVTSLKKTSSQTGVNLAPPAPPTFSAFPPATNKTPFEIAGHVETGNTVLIDFNGTEDEIESDQNGNFSEKLNLIKGTNTFFAYAKDAAGNKSQPTSTNTIIYDNTPPTITISSPSDGANFYGAKEQSVTITGSTKTDSTLTINDRIVPVNDDGSFSTSFQLASGENNLKIKAVDQAGNEKEMNLKLNFYQ